MQENKLNDLTEGDIVKKLLWVAVPIMGTQLIQMTYNLTGMFWLGLVSSDLVAASGTGGLFIWLSMAFLLIGRMGAEIGVSQNLGRGDTEAAKSFSQNATLIAVVLGVLYGLLLAVANVPLVSFFNIGDPYVVNATEDYLRIMGAFMPFFFVGNAMLGAFNGAGNSRMSFYCTTVGLVLNMVLDPIFILWFDWGIKGAAYAAVIAQAVVCTMFFIAIKKSKGRPFTEYTYFKKPDLDKIKQIFKWSTPIGLESMFFTLLTMIVSRFVAEFGVDAMAVQRIGAQIESLSWLIAGGFGSAVTAFVGQNYGSGKWDRIHKGFRISSGLMTVYGVAITLILFFGGKYLFFIFVREPEIIAMGADYLKILAVCQIVACLEGVGSGSFRGTGRTMPPSISSIISNVIRVPLCYCLGQTSLGLNGIFWGVAISAFIRSSVIYVWYYLSARKGKSWTK